MDDIRKGQIAVLCIKQVVKQRRANLDPIDFNEALKKLSDDLNISIEEVREFAQIIYGELFTEMLNKKA